MNTITFTKIKNGCKGNPRYVCHFHSFIADISESNLSISAQYAIVCKRVNTIGGRKYHTKSYGGGIVFSSYSLEETVQHINRVCNTAYAGYTLD